MTDTGRSEPRPIASSLPPEFALRPLMLQNGPFVSSGRMRAASPARIPAAVLFREVHTPIHASWLNQLEVYFSVIQRKLLTPSTFDSLVDLKHALMGFQARYQRAAKPFKWTFTRRDLHVLLAKLQKRRTYTRKFLCRNT